MNFRNTILMAVVLLVLGSLFVFREKVEAPDEEAAKTPKLTDFKEEDVVGVDISKDGKTLVLQKKDDTWYVMKPYHALANRADMSSLMSQLGGVKADRVLNESVARGAWKQYGLEKPKATFTAILKDGAKHALEIGDRAPNDNGWYVRVAGKPELYLSGNTLTFAINKPIDGWRDKNPVTADLEQMDRVALTGPGVDLQVDRAKDADKWTMVKPRKGAAEGAEVKKYVGGLKNLVIDTFFDKMSADKVKPVYTLKIWIKDRRDPDTLVVGQAAPGGYYAVRADNQVREVFLLPASALATLKVDPSLLADRHLFPLEPEKAAKAEIDVPGTGKATAQKKEGTTWNFTAPVAKPDEMGKVTALTWSLKDVKYERRVSDATELARAKKSLAKPAVIFDLKDVKGAVLAHLVVGGPGPTPGSRYVLGKDPTTVYVAQVPFANDWKGVILGLKTPAPKGSPAPAASK